MTSIVTMSGCQKRIELRAIMGYVVSFSLKKKSVMQGYAFRSASGEMRIDDFVKGNLECLKSKRTVWRRA